MINSKIDCSIGLMLKGLISLSLSNENHGRPFQYTVSRTTAQECSAFFKQYQPTVRHPMYT